MTTVRATKYPPRLFDVDPPAPLTFSFFSRYSPHSASTCDAPVALNRRGRVDRRYSEVPSLKQSRPDQCGCDDDARMAVCYEVENV